MSTAELDYRNFSIAVVIPAYKVEGQISRVLTSLPGFISHIIVVNDCSPDETRQQVMAAAECDKRIILINHEQNQGVGGAMVSGFRKALELQAQIVVKIDGDGQMDSKYISALITPLILGEADYSKGNRFWDIQAISSMPFVRRVGNLGLSFLTKAATGYWNCFDPTNGFLAIRSELLNRLSLEKIDRRYFFEISLLSYLYLENACIRDVPISAIYKDEKSNLSVRKVLFEFPAKLITTFLRRMYLKYYLRDFSVISVYLVTGISLFGFGLIFGIINWIHYASLNIPAPTGTVMLATLPIILGIQILLSATEIDLNSVPRLPTLKPLFDR
jgi:glycosyltransferase involved in cell wall biosynthesis